MEAKQYHVFEVDYEEYNLLGSADTLQEAYRLCKNPHRSINLYMIDENGSLKLHAYLLFEPRLLSKERQEIVISWDFMDDSKEVMDSYTEKWITNERVKPAFGAIYATGLFMPGCWARETDAIGS